MNIWYDKGLNYTENYDEKIKMKIQNSFLFIICFTERVIESAHNPDEYMKIEVKHALNAKINIIPIYIHDVELKDYYKDQLASIHSIFRKYYDSHENFIKECISAFNDELEKLKKNHVHSHDMKEMIITFM